MIRPDVIKWNQTPDDLRRLATEAEHPRTRERFLALYMIATDQSNATEWAKQIGRNDESVMGWVHQYNQSGPDALIYRHTGGVTPLLRRRKPSRLSKPLKTPSRRRMACLGADGR